MSLIYSVISFLIAIVMLVSVHELGHLLVARLCGIRVLRFSVGFGQPIWRKTWRNIEWTIAPIPLGGYVKMLDSRTMIVDQSEKNFAFDTQKPYKRILVAAAGPVSNFLLAIVLYAFSFHIGGVTEIRPAIGTVYEHSIAQRAGLTEGDTILSVNQKPIANWQDAYTAIILNINDDVQITVRDTQGKTHTRTLIATPDEIQALSHQSRNTQVLGITPYRVLNQIGGIMPASPAEKAGLKSGDQIIEIDGQAVQTWQDWTNIIRQNAGRNLNITVLRQNEKWQTQVLPESYNSEDGSKILGRIGVYPQNDEKWARQITQTTTPNLTESLILAGQKTKNFTQQSLEFFAKLLTGKASINHIAGPVGMAEMTGTAVQIGWQPYIEFMALMSVSLGVMNLLPIPNLDGGHILFSLIEMIRGKPLSEHWQQMGLQLGFILILCLIILALVNDFSRLFG